MSKKYTDTISPDKIKFVQSILENKEVREAWDYFLKLGQPYPCAPSKVYEERQKAFNNYCKLRDEFLGLPPLKLVGVQQSHARYRRA